MCKGRLIDVPSSSQPTNANRAHAAVRIAAISGAPCVGSASARTAGGALDSTLSVVLGFMDWPCERMLEGTVIPKMQAGPHRGLLCDPAPSKESMSNADEVALGDLTFLCSLSLHLNLPTDSLRGFGHMHLQQAILEGSLGLGYVNRRRQQNRPLNPGIPPFSPCLFLLLVLNLRLLVLGNDAQHVVGQPDIKFGRLKSRQFGPDQVLLLCFIGVHCHRRCEPALRFHERKLKEPIEDGPEVF